MSKRHAVFLINLLQDVNIVRPLVFMAARDLGLRTEFLVAHKFLERDKSSIWQNELNEIGQATGTPVLGFENEMEAMQMLQGKAGALVAASESSLAVHALTHDVFRFAPSSFLKITLQHGFECVGFLQSRDHDLAFGEGVTFAADVVCGWCEGSRLSSMAPSQRSKLYVSGPPAVLQIPRRRAGEGQRPERGLVCENLHSARLKMAGDFKTAFIDMFNDFCAALAKDGRAVTLRPHPGGQYMLNKKVTLPHNVILNNNPIYKVDLTQYAYGVSAPSSVVIDMALAGIPVAVWRDGAGVMDAGNYEGLTEISTLGDWLDFGREADSHPERFVERQQRFLEEQQMPIEPADVYRRFAALFAAAKNTSRQFGSTARETERILFVSNSHVPTLQLSFVKPLAPLVDAGEVATDFVTEQQMKESFGDRLRDNMVHRWLDKRLAMFRPTILVFCRYSGPHAEHLVEWAHREEIPVIYHVDDDLLNIPLEIGLVKYTAHNHPLRLAAVRYLLDHADLVYCSTDRLLERFRALGVSSPMVAGGLYCSGRVIVSAAIRPIQKIGYMGFDHSHDLETILPALVQFLRRNPHVGFDLFGSIPKPAALDEFEGRITVIPPVRNYEDFLNEFARLDWDVGICPLASTDFNRVKANTKWVEYTSVGAAVVASRGTVYDDCCADGCGILASTMEEWLAALEELAHDPNRRFTLVSHAQKKLINEYATERLREQVLGVFEQARSLSQSGYERQSSPLAEFAEA